MFAPPTNMKLRLSARTCRVCNRLGVVANTNEDAEYTRTLASTIWVRTRTRTNHTTKRPRARDIPNAAGNTSRGYATTSTIATHKISAMPTSNGHYDGAHAINYIHMITRPHAPIALSTIARSRPTNMILSNQPATRVLARAYIHMRARGRIFATTHVV